MHIQRVSSQQWEAFRGLSERHHEENWALLPTTERFKEAFDHKHYVTTSSRQSEELLINFGNNKMIMMAQIKLGGLWEKTLKLALHLSVTALPGNSKFLWNTTLTVGKLWSNSKFDSIAKNPQNKMQYSFKSENTKNQWRCYCLAFLFFFLT